ncbi:CapA family protein [Celeribacter baekdonensis]|uniref:UDP-N-acetylmuramoyL-tripeptide--D-alanyL-D-alanine ligase n=1 Tax=Celeribacter baekdonensis B30 TaxID=1208323 RepID=K2J602_9RHOB|nr:CapA family protein [Celeribacter baekdonensis]EKE70322.1 UDP-N-acetylmuramoyL-tripeptide--D-alanyL-D-alanine ligase [Celeribacter baekdonensis B30]
MGKKKRSRNVPKADARQGKTDTPYALMSPLARHPKAPLTVLLAQAKAALTYAVVSSGVESPASAPLRLFFSMSDGTKRAEVVHFVGRDLADIWEKVEAWRGALANPCPSIRWLRVDWVDQTWDLTWHHCQLALENSKRSYFRYGLALDRGFEQAFLEQELNANAMLYLGGTVEQAGVNEKNFNIYGRRRFGAGFQLPQDPAHQIRLFSTQAFLLQPNHGPIRLHGFCGGAEGRDTGRRVVTDLDETTVESMIAQSSRFLAAQVDEQGQFVYGLHPCFDREIKAYNTLRHTSTIYSMLEAWEVTRDAGVKAAIDRALRFMTQNLIRRFTLPDGKEVAYLQDLNNEFKLGGSAVALLALVKYTELTGDQSHLSLLDHLAEGIRRVQDPETGQLPHVLNSTDLSVKETFRIIYYDGEAAFGLMRLYGLTKDARWLQTVEKAFDYFIAQQHWKSHDHWLSYCVNELTLYRPEERYFRFGIQNVVGHLDFVIDRITTFPTLLELMMAAHKMIVRLQASEAHRPLLKHLDLDKFYRALETRAHYLMNGFFWPEIAMYFKNPQRILGSFFIRHHGFRVRIDDVEHYLSGYTAYLLHYLRDENRPSDVADSPKQAEHVLDVGGTSPMSASAILAWGGDVNLGRRQHYRSKQLGYDQVLDIPELKSADLSIVNLECVVSSLGAQGVIKGEGGPYYYRARPEMLNILTAANIDAVAVANNHSGDYGPQALMQQQDILRALGIAYAGSGRTRDEAFRPTFCTAGAVRVALFSVDATQFRFAATDETPGTAYVSLDDPHAWREEFEPRIAEAKKQADLAIIAVHWGANNAPAPDDDEIAVGHALIDAGADAVLGASAHRLQGIEIYKAKPIIHDAGDLLFDSIRSQFSDGGVFRLGLSPEGVKWVEFIPIGVGFGFSQRLRGDAARGVIQRFQSKCQSIGTTLTCHEDRAYVPLVPRSEADKPVAQTDALSRCYPVEVLQSYEVDTLYGQVPYVPEGARIKPLKINGLTLLGVRLTPQHITHRRMLWVETWWSSDVPISEDLRLSYTAIPRGQGPLVEWGRGMDHDPCDWMLPTRRWTPGRIYRDHFGLRPPPLKHLSNAPLQLEIRVLGRAPNTQCYLHPKLVPVQLTQTDTSLSLSYRTQFPDLVSDSPSGQTWTAEQLQAITGGRWLTAPQKGWFVRSVVNGQKHIDMRDTPVLFVAHTNRERAFHEGTTQPTKTIGDRHPVVAQNVHRLAGAIVSKAVADVPSDFPQLLVDDPIKAHMELGFAARQRFQGPVIAVTGTVGKSSTLGLLETLFDPGCALKSVDNYNSRVGVPIQLSSLAPDHQAALLEIAQSALWMSRGPITRWVRPTIAMITEIGLSQTNRMIKTTEDVAQWKSRVFDGLMPGGIAVIGEHLAHFETIHAKATQHASRVLTFGPSPNAHLRVLNQITEGRSTRLTVELAGQTHEVTLPFVSQGMLNNAVATLAVAHALGRDVQDSAQRLETYRPEEGRLVQYVCHLGGHKVRVLDDSWNAEILSMLNAFTELERQQVAGRKIAVLGRIVHLGDQAATLHETLAAPLLASGATLVLTHGDEMRHLRKRLPEAVLGPHFSSAPALFTTLKGAVKEGDFILLKGSRRDSDFGDLSRWLNTLKVL